MSDNHRGNLCVGFFERHHQAGVCFAPLRSLFHPVLRERTITVRLRQCRINANSGLVNQYAIVGITVGMRMSLHSHRRYQKTHQIELNHERGCMFAPILVPTLPSTGYNSSRKLWLLAAKVHRTVCYHFRSGSAPFVTSVANEIANPLATVEVHFRMAEMFP